MAPSCRKAWRWLTWALAGAAAAAPPDPGELFGAACGRDSAYRAYTWSTLSLLTRNSQARLEALGIPTYVADTRSRIALAAFQGFLIEYFTADDPSYVDDTFARFVDEFLLAPWSTTDQLPQR